MKSKKFVWIAAAILLVGMISSCEELGIDGIEDIFPPTPGPTPGGGTSVEVDFNEVTADGGEGYATTALTLHFSEAIAGLKADDITLTPLEGANTGITKGELEGEGPSYTLYVSGITAEGEVAVAVAKAGYVIVPPSKEVSVHFGSGTPTTVVFSSLEANSSETGTTYLTLTFGSEVELDKGNISLNGGGTEATADSLTSSGGSKTSYTLNVSGIQKSGDVSVTVTKGGHVFSPPTKTVTVLGSDVRPPQPGGGQGGEDGEPIGTGTPVTFTGVSADGGEGYATTALSLHFNKAIAGLSEGDITLTPVGDANKNITKGTLEGRGPSYTLYVSNVRVEGFVKVSVKKGGYAVSGTPRTVAVHTAGSDQKTAKTVYFSSLSADGVKGEEATDKLTLTFDSAVSSLNKADIYLNAGGTGAVKGELSGVGPSYNLTVSGIENGGIVSVTVTKTGYAFKPTTQAATVYSGDAEKDKSLSEVTLDKVEANGTSQNGNTTELTLTFSSTITGLTADHITITNNNDGWAVKNGSLKGSDNMYTLPVFVTKTGQVTVSVSNPEEYVILNPSQSVQVNHSVIELTPDASTNPSIKAKFGIQAGETDGVTAAFNALSAYIKTAEFKSNEGVIHLGDWIDLEGGLTVAAYNGKGAIYNLQNIAITPSKLPFSGYEGKTLRLIVVGINSFHSGRGMTATNTITQNGDTTGQYAETANDNTPHVVFQFQNIPVTRRMNSTVVSKDGYEASEMRKYLTDVNGDEGSGRFLAGLIEAGVPKGVLWAPKRIVFKCINPDTDSRPWGSNEISDLLWLPTERELRGDTSIPAETVVSQARLEYYDRSARRKKYQKESSDAEVYWQATSGNYWFRSVNRDDLFFTQSNDSSNFGCVPAFCVR